MAPFPRQGHRQNRNRRKERGLARTTGKKSLFHVTRIEEPESDGLSDGQELEIENEQERDNSSDGDSAEDTASATTDALKPYNLLLQTLNRQNEYAQQPARKKHKLNREIKPEILPYLPQPGFIDPEFDLDHADDAEEHEITAAEEIDDADIADNEHDAKDYYELHFASPNEKVLALYVKSLPNPILERKGERWAAQEWISQELFFIGDPLHAEVHRQKFSSIDNLQLKTKLKRFAERLLPDISNNALQNDIAREMFCYRDLFFSDRTTENAQDLRSLACLHALNHVFKIRDRVIKNNARIAKADTPAEVEYRDQGFTRPKVLMLLPTRQACVKAVEAMTSLCEPEQQENKKRFQDSYSQAEESVTGDKPEDFKELFGGNDDDLFRLGLKFTRKTMKYFSQFYNSDIILASPLGLRLAIGTEEEKKQDHDFLSSIEIVIVDQADALLTQNWDHVQYIFEHINLLPKEAHGCDFSRAKNYYLDGNAKYLRQTIMFSAYNTPELNSLYTQHMLNMAGKSKVKRRLYRGSILDLNIQVKQKFTRYDAPELTADPDARFKYFIITIMPLLTKYTKSSSGNAKGVLVFVPSYMDFVRIRNYLAGSTAAQNLSFGSISEYTPLREVARARSHFYTGKHSVLLYTGRAHHFRRYRIRGAKKIIMYGLPDNPKFYAEIAGGFLAVSIAEGRLTPEEASVRSIFSKWDILKLERIVGTQRYMTLLRDKGGDTFDFL